MLIKLHIVNHQTNFFIKLNTLKFRDLVDFKTVQIMYKAENKLLPNNIQKLFQKRENEHSLRGLSVFKQPLVRTNAKYHCVSVKGVTLWNKSRDELKKSQTWKRFKNMFKRDRLSSYRNGGRIWTELGWVQTWAELGSDLDYHFVLYSSWLSVKICFVFCFMLVLM